jgi:hypothetical protein
MAFGIAFENGIRYDGRTGGEAHKPRTDRMEKEFKLETAPYSGMAENGMICYKGVVFTCDTENNRICLGDTTDLKKCINIPLAGGCGSTGTIWTSFPGRSECFCRRMSSALCRQSHRIQRYSRCKRNWTMKRTALVIWQPVNKVWC